MCISYLEVVLPAMTVMQTIYPPPTFFLCFFFFCTVIPPQHHASLKPSLLSPSVGRELRGVAIPFNGSPAPNISRSRSRSNSPVSHQSAGAGGACLSVVREAAANESPFHRDKDLASALVGLLERGIIHGHAGFIKGECGYFKKRGGKKKEKK